MSDHRVSNEHSDADFDHEDGVADEHQVKPLHTPQVFMVFNNKFTLILLNIYI